MDTLESIRIREILRRYLPKAPDYMNPENRKFYENNVESALVEILAAIGE